MCMRLEETVAVIITVSGCLYCSGLCLPVLSGKGRSAGISISLTMAFLLSSLIICFTFDRSLAFLSFCNRFFPRPKLPCLQRGKRWLVVVKGVFWAHFLPRVHQQKWRVLSDGTKDSIMGWWFYFRHLIRDSENASQISYSPPWENIAGWAHHPQSLTGFFSSFFTECTILMYLKDRFYFFL